MEFPSVGANCAFVSCQSHSFLPFECSFCGSTFCGTHRLPQDHDCTNWSMNSYANSVEVCEVCQKMVLVPKLQDPKTILTEHQSSGCTTHLLPPVHSIAVLCGLAPRCKRRDRVVQTCPDCGVTFCLAHRHAVDHACSKIGDRKRQAEAEMQRKKDLGAEIKEKFGIVPGDGKAKARKEGGEGQNEEEKKRERAEKAKAAIAEAKAKVAARNNAAGTGVAAEAGGPTSTTKTMASTPPKVKKASRVVSVMKLKKIAQGEDKVPLSSRIYVSIRSPTFPHLDDKAVYIDKTWTVGRSLDKILEWLKIVVPKNEPFDAQKRFSIFHAKDIGDIPVVLNMQDRLQQMAQVESGDIFYLAPADCTWPST